MQFEYIKALHIIFVVTWFAGLFYLPRLFIYLTEAHQKDEPEKSILVAQYKKMMKPLWYGITWPSAILTYVFGFWTLYVKFGTDIPGWLFLKLAFVFGLTLYHLQCGIMYNQLQRDIVKRSSFVLRMWNEVATLFLVAIVFIVELQGRGNWVWGLVGLVIFAGLLTAAIFMYRKRRGKIIKEQEQKEEKN
jgi:putative membrane protein